MALSLLRIAPQLIYDYLGPPSRRRRRIAQQRNRSKELGLKCWFEPQDCEVDICFVHGLAADATQTWTSYDPDTKANIFWPRDFLAVDLSHAAIYTYAYETDVSNSGYLTKRTLYEYAKYLIDDLVEERKNHPNRPLIFVAHSVGGILVKSALIFSREAEITGQKESSIFFATVGAVFFATPHTGIGSLSWGERAPFLATRKLDGKNMEILPEHALELESLLDRYKVLSAAIPQVFLYETKPLDSKIVVSRSSAAPKGFEKMAPRSYAAGLKGDHITLQKFTCRESLDYKEVLRAMRDLVKNSSESILRRRSKHKIEHGALLATSLSGFLEKFHTEKVFLNAPPKNEGFRPREQQLQDIDRCFEQSAALKKMVVLSGDEGVGKTQIALHYAHTRRDNFNGVFWLHADSHAAVISSLWKIGRSLIDHYHKKWEHSGHSKEDVAEVFGLKTILDEDRRLADSGTKPSKDDGEPSRDDSEPSRDDVELVAKSVLEFFDVKSVKGWLLVYDGVRDLDMDDLSQYLPASASVNGFILFTTGNAHLLSKRGSNGEGIQVLPTLNIAEGRAHSHSPQFYGPARSLTTSLPSRPPSSQPPSLGRSTSWFTMVIQKSQKLDKEVIPVEQFSPTTSLQILRGNRPESAEADEEADMLEIRHAVRDHPASITQARDYMDTAEVTPAEYRSMLENKPEKQPTSGNIDCYLILDALCIMSPQDIPVELLKPKQREHILSKKEFFICSSDGRSFTLPEIHRETRQKAVENNETLHPTKSLNEHEPKDRKKVERFRKLGRRLHSAWKACKMIAMARQNFRSSTEDPLERWLYDLRLAQHACFGRNFVDDADELGKEPAGWAILGAICERHHHPQDALCYYKAALAGVQNGPDRLERALPLKLGLAKTYEALGNVGEAESFCNEVLKASRRLGIRDLELEAMRVQVAISTRKGAWHSAIVQSQRLIESLEIDFGSCSMQTVNAVSQLATLQANHGRLQDAALMVERLLMTWEEKLHEAAPKAICSLETLALLNRKQGYLDDAIRMYERIVHLKGLRLGVDHIETLKSQAELALAHDAQHNFEMAEKLFDQAIDGLRYLGESNPEYLRVYENSALCLKRQGKAKAASERYEYVLERKGEAEKSALEKGSMGMEEEEECANCRWRSRSSSRSDGSDCSR